MHKTDGTRMWANAERYGRPAEIGDTLCSTPQSWLTPITRVPRSNAENIGERKTWTQSEFCTWQNSIRLSRLHERHRQTDRRAIEYSERELTFTFAKMI